MGGFDPVAWDDLLCRLVAHNLKLFGQGDAIDGSHSDSGVNDKLKRWKNAQTGLRQMLKLGAGIQDMLTTARGKWTFDQEMRALDQKDVEEEFESYFSDLVSAVQQHNNKFVTAMEVLKEVIALEKDTLALKHKASTVVTTDLFQATKSSSNLMDELNKLNQKKCNKLDEVYSKYGKQLEAVTPITKEELLPFIECVDNS